MIKPIEMPFWVPWVLVDKYVQRSMLGVDIATITIAARYDILLQIEQCDELDCPLVMTVNPAKMVEPIKMLFVDQEQCVSTVYTFVPRGVYD